MSFKSWIPGGSKGGPCHPCFPRTQREKLQQSVCRPVPGTGCALHTTHNSTSLPLVLVSQMVRNLILQPHSPSSFLVPTMSGRVPWGVDTMTKLEVGASCRREGAGASGRASATTQVRLERSRLTLGGGGAHHRTGHRRRFALGRCGWARALALCRHRRKAAQEEGPLGANPRVDPEGAAARGRLTAPLRVRASEQGI